MMIVDTEVILNTYKSKLGVVLLGLDKGEVVPCEVFSCLSDYHNLNYNDWYF